LAYYVYGVYGLPMVRVDGETKQLIRRLVAVYQEAYPDQSWSENRALKELLGPLLRSLDEVRSGRVVRMRLIPLSEDVLRRLKEEGLV